jgi:uncharacterized tellurite resistance protein B-like protein
MSKLGWLKKPFLAVDPEKEAREEKAKTNAAAENMGGAGEVQLLAAMMLIAVAKADGEIDETERAQVMQELKGHFGLCDKSVMRLYAAALKRMEEEKLPITADLLPELEKRGLTLDISHLRETSVFIAASKLVEKMEEHERRALVSMVHQIVYADGVLEPAEAAILNSMGAGLGLTTSDAATIRAAVKKLLAMRAEEQANDIVAEKALAHNDELNVDAPEPEPR